MMSNTPILTAAGAVTLRPEATDGSDEPFLYALFADSKPEMTLMPVHETVKEQLLRMQYRSMTMTYRGQFPDARFQIAELDGVPVGRMITDVQATSIYFVDIVVLSRTQGTGIGTALVRAVFEEARQRGLAVTSKVLVTNAASLRMCEKVGFYVVRHDPPYVDLIWPEPAPA